MNNPVKTALEKRKVTVGTWLQVGHPAVAEILSAAGFDWLAVDMEHTDIDVGGFAALARAMASTKTMPLARVRANEPLAIRQVLDAGAMGVIVPLVHTADQAAAAVAAAKFPPDGVRGYSFCRANQWGAGFDVYAAGANRAVAVIAMIESRQAVENIDAICAVGGLDGVFVGPYDMSGSFGRPGETSAAEVRDACRTVVDACQRARMSAGMHVVVPGDDNLRATVQAGYTCLAVGTDTVFLRYGGAQALQLARGAT